MFPSNWHNLTVHPSYACRATNITHTSVTRVSRAHDRWDFSERGRFFNRAIFLRRGGFDARSTRVYAHTYTRRVRARVHASYRSPPVLSLGGVCNRVGEPKRGALGVGEERCTPSYFTVITVTCYRARSLRHAINRRLPLPWVARKEGTGVGGVHRGVIVAPYTPPSNPRANLCDAVYGYVTVVTSFSSLSPVLTWDRSSKNRAPKISRKSKMTMTGLEFVSFVLIYSDVYLIILFLVYISKL